MAAETSIGKDRPHIAIEADLALARSHPDEQRRGTNPSKTRNHPDLSPFV
jgi:hypothetical protein